jgi:hypothetical protein
VPGQRQQVDTELVDACHNLAQRLRRVGMEEDASSASDLGDRLDRLDRDVPGSSPCAYQVRDGYGEGAFVVIDGTK